MNLTLISHGVAAFFLAGVLMALGTGCSKGPKTFGSLNAKMEHQASLAAEAVKAETGLVLDYTILSIKLVDQRLDRLATNVGKTDPAKASLEAETCGAYVGECLRKKQGGEWTEDKADEKSSYQLKTPAGLAFTPVNWCYDRIIGEQKQSVYKKVLAETGSSTGRK
jgi:hypothetical protein